MRTALRTAIATALVAGVAITAPAFAAGAAFAADGPAGPAKAAVSAAGTATPAPAATRAPVATPAPAATTSAPAPVASAATPAPAATTSAPAAAQADPAKGTLVRTETLVTGTVAKIYKVKPQNYRAELFRQGHPVGVLEAITRSAAAQDNGEFFVLNPDGTTHNWIGNTAPNTPGRYRLVDGTVLELGKKDGRFGLQLIENGKGRGYTYVNGVRAVWTFGRAVVVLEQDGRFSAYVPGAARQAAPERVTDTATPAPGTGGVITHGKCTVSKVVGIGAGTEAELFMTRQGPVAEFSDAGDGKVFALVDRAHPSLPASVGFVGRIINPNSATPSLYTKVEGGGAKGATNSFPKLPKGCEPETAPAPSATTGTGAVQQGGQTSVVPKGGVAAGAEPGTEGGSTALTATGAGAASLAAAGLGFVVLRRRAASRV
ncbi:hypothetical protein ACFQ7A_26145 [Streptomyces sp. NPDC056528]|uniref:hypothetical protein n=1 Tax=Streptomyces sp. NPDC056528 TaxID=3345854 RepID=UPI00368BFC64